MPQPCGSGVIPVRISIFISGGTDDGGCRCRDSVRCTVRLLIYAAGQFAGVTPFGSREPSNSATNL